MVLPANSALEPAGPKKKKNFVFDGRANQECPHLELKSFMRRISPPSGPGPKNDFGGKFPLRGNVLCIFLSRPHRLQCLRCCGYSDSPTGFWVRGGKRPKVQFLKRQTFHETACSVVAKHQCTCLTAGSMDARSKCRARRLRRGVLRKALSTASTREHATRKGEGALAEDSRGMSSLTRSVQAVRKFAHPRRILVACQGNWPKFLHMKRPTLSSKIVRELSAKNPYARFLKAGIDTASARPTHCVADRSRELGR